MTDEEMARGQLINRIRSIRILENDLELRLAIRVTLHSEDLRELRLRYEGQLAAFEPEEALR